MPTDRPEEIVDAILADLNNRSGVGIECCDQHIQDEIREDLIQLVEGWLPVYLLSKISEDLQAACEGIKHKLARTEYAKLLHAIDLAQKQNTREALEALGLEFLGKTFQSEYTRGYNQGSSDLTLDQVEELAQLKVDNEALRTAVAALKATAEARQATIDRITESNRWAGEEIKTLKGKVYPLTITLTLDEVEVIRADLLASKDRVITVPASPTLEATGCVNCPFCDKKGIWNCSAAGCKDIDGEDPRPDWCPLVNGPITVKLKANEEGCTCQPTDLDHRGGCPFNLV